MSVIGAKTFFFFEGDSQPDTHIICRPDYFQQDGFRLPASGVTLLYGHKGPGSLIGAAVRQSASSGAGVCFADVKIDIGEWDANKQKLDNFGHCRFLNLPQRANREVLDDINQHWNRWLDEEGAPNEDFPRKASNRMDLLDKLVALPPYSELNAIAYDVQTRFGAAKFLTVFNMDAIRTDETTVIPPGTNVMFQTPGAECPDMASL